MMNNNNIPNIPAEKFRFVADEERLHDRKLETKKIGYFRDAFRRFCKNKSSVVAAIIILCLALYALLVPIFGETTYSKSLTDTTYMKYLQLTPKSSLFTNLGIDFWNGTKTVTAGETTLLGYQAIGVETGYTSVTKIKGSEINDEGALTYTFKIDTYITNGFEAMDLTEEEYLAIQQWQIDTGIQVIYPVSATETVYNNANIWYKANKKGVAILDADGNFQANYKTSGNDGGYNSLRIDGDPAKDVDDPTTVSNRYRYAKVGGTSDAKTYTCRVFLYTYFQYRYGYEPSFLFGTNSLGQDIFTRLASGARFSLLFAIAISAINLFIGVIYGSIEGYFGGAVDMVMERVTDVLARIPFMVVATLFNLHLASKVGAVPSLLFAFVLTGWIGTAGTVRMQFYRFKGQEYVLAARVLGASDWRIMFRHIFPNSLGTLITSSVLVIPGVIFSESTLTYLGIVNLNSSTRTSVGTMLANGQGSMSTFPHIILFPALFIALLEVSFNLFGNGLRDAFNPSLRGADE